MFSKILTSNLIKMINIIYKADSKKIDTKVFRKVKLPLLNDHLIIKGIPYTIVSIRNDRFENYIIQLDSL